MTKNTIDKTAQIFETYKRWKLSKHRYYEDRYPGYCAISNESTRRWLKFCEV